MAQSTSIPRGTICNYGARIRHKRIMLGMTQEQLATKANLDRKSVSRIENGHGGIRLRTIRPVLKALNIIQCKECTGCRDDLRER